MLILGISTVIFTSCSKDDELSKGEWVEINGVKWATRNVGSPGMFVKNPKDYGEYYPWNGGVIDSDTWEKENCPCPAGYHVPTIEEFDKLLDKFWVTREKIVIDGVKGIKFTYKANGNSIFLPAAGVYYSDGNLVVGVGLFGEYWSSSASSSDNSVYNTVYVLKFDYLNLLMISTVKSSGISVRCVSNN